MTHQRPALDLLNDIGRGKLARELTEALHELNTACLGIFTVEHHDDDRGPLRDLADWHDTKAEKARRFPGVGPENVAVMEKAAQVHEDAARRIREAVSRG